MKYNFVLMGDFSVVSNATMTQDKANELNAENAKTQDFKYWVWQRVN